MSIFRMLKVTEQINRGHRPTRTPGRTEAAPPPAGGTSYQTGTAPSGGPLPAEAQIMLRVMGEDLDAALALVRGMSQQDRDIYGFYLAQCMELIYRVDGA